MQKHSNKNIIDNDSIQGAIEAALLTLIPKPINRPTLHLTSRTDCGVHGLCSIGSLILENKYDTIYEPDQSKRCLNRYFKSCSHFIRIIEFFPVKDDFTFKKIIKSKTYIYRFMKAKENNEHRIPILETLHTFNICTETLDIDRMKKATQLFMGFKDFRTFTPKLINNDVKYVRNLHSLTIEETQPLMPFDELSNYFTYWHIVISSKGFLYNQVRRIVAVLLELGKGKITERDINIMLQVPSDRTWRSNIPVVPPYGLHLMKLDLDLDKLNQYVIKNNYQEENVLVVNS